MSKFRMKLKLQGLELEIEGHREDASVIGRNVGDQIAGLLGPAVQIIEGETPATQSGSPIPPMLADGAGKKAKRRPKPRANGDAGERGASPMIEFRHDPAKFGTPSQQWSTAQKAIWLLYVLKETADVPELTTGQIVKMFNTHFRQAKTVTNSNVSRDLGKLKIASPSQVGEDNSKTPASWFLTEHGIRQAQSLIAESLMPRAA